MKTTTILATAALGLTLASCGDAASVSDYNAKAIAIFNPIDTRVAALESVIEGEPAQAIAELDGCTKSVDSGLAEINKLKVPEKAQAMHRSIVSIMTYERDTMLPLLKKAVGAQDDPAALESIPEELNNMSARVITLTNNMQAEQQKLAASVGAKVK